MNHSQIDISLLNSIEPKSLVEYLKDNGWNEQQKVDTRASIWTKVVNGKRYSILLPLETEIPDFTDRMYEVLKTLEFLEQRPISEIFAALIEVREIAVEKQTEILSLKFKFVYKENSKEVPAKKMGNVLTSLQDLFDAVGQSESGNSSTVGKIPQDVLKKTELHLFETFKGSFGVRLALAPPQQLHLFEPPLAERVSQSFIELIKRSNFNDKKALKDYLLRIKRRAASRYRKFLMTLINSEANFYVNWGSVNPTKGGQAKLTFDNAIATIEFINKMEVEEPEQYNINGELIAASKANNSFEIKEFSEGKKYFGKVAENIANNKDVELTIGRLYSATIQEVSSINPATGEEKTEYTAINLSYWNHDKQRQ